MDPALVIFLGTTMFAIIVLGPIFGAESRPAFLRPDRKPRPMVGPIEEWGRPD
jgi:hypothetical protein